jgi:hypothetical protein
VKFANLFPVPGGKLIVPRTILFAMVSIAAGTHPALHTNEFIKNLDFLSYLRVQARVLFGVSRILR